MDGWDAARTGGGHTDTDTDTDTNTNTADTCRRLLTNRYSCQWGLVRDLQ